ncbi:MAG: hypothetical protein ACRCVJ_01000 [Clostridium sp.]|uniref:hypothetical protein n=1 Tax=Clostridium sp. TaxID=1506 RepID=UPI003F2D2B40
MKKMLITLMIGAMMLTPKVCLASETDTLEKGNLGVTDVVDILDSEKSEKLDRAKSLERNNEKSIKATSKINKIGTSIQSKSNYCGPATLYNMVYGYDVANFGSYCTYITDTVHPDRKRLMNQNDYATVLGTSSNGTNFGDRFKNSMNRYMPDNNYLVKEGKNYSSTNWRSEVKSSIVYTTNKDNGYKKKNYPVLANQYKDSSTSNAVIHPVYSGTSRHYLAVYGYNSSGSTAYISDSNANAPRTFTTSTEKLANASKARGIIW